MIQAFDFCKAVIRKEFVDDVFDDILSKMDWKSPGCQLMAEKGSFMKFSILEAVANGDNAHIETTIGELKMDNFKTGTFVLVNEKTGQRLYIGEKKDCLKKLSELDEETFDLAGIYSATKENNSITLGEKVF
jgi:hypothetical protein